MKQERRPITAANKANDFMNDYALKPLTKYLRAPRTNWIFISAKIFGLFLVFDFVAALIIPAQNEHFVNRHKLSAFSADSLCASQTRGNALIEGKVMELSGEEKLYKLYADGCISVSGYRCCLSPWRSFERWMKLMKVNDQGKEVKTDGGKLGLFLQTQEGQAEYITLKMAKKDEESWMLELDSVIEEVQIPTDTEGSKIQKAVLNKDGHLNTWNITKQILKSTGIKDVFFITDVHGCIDVLQEKMRQRDLIDEDGKWIALNTLLVHGGDIMDRGPKSAETIKYMRQLYKEVTQKPNTFNSLFLIIFGNHDVRYLESNGGPEAQIHVPPWANQPMLDSWIRTYAATSKEFLVGKSETWGNYKWMNHTFSRTGYYGKWLRNAGSVSLLIGDNKLFVHAGFDPEFLKIMRRADMTGRDGLDGLNSTFRKFLTGTHGSDRVIKAILNNQYGPLWTRYWQKKEGEKTKCGYLDVIKSHFGIYNGEKGWFMIIGHNADVSRLEGDCDSRLLRLDFGMFRYPTEEVGNVLVVFDP